MSDMDTNTNKTWTHRVDFTELDAKGFGTGRILATEFHISRADAIAACLRHEGRGTKVSRVQV